MCQKCQPLHASNKALLYSYACVFFTHLPFSEDPRTIHLPCLSQRLSDGLGRHVALCDNQAGRVRTSVATSSPKRKPARAFKVAVFF